MLARGTNPASQQNLGVDPLTGRAMDTPGYHPVNNPAPNPFSTYEPGVGGLSVPPSPALFLINTNPQGLQGFTIPKGHGLAWEQQLFDSLHLLILMMYMDLWILFPISRWT